MMDKHLDALLSRNFGGSTTMLGALELVTISKLLSHLCTCLFIHIIHSMFMFQDFYVLHVAFTCLNVECVKTCIYTYMNSELQLTYIYLNFMLICIHYMHVYRLVLMIRSLILVMPIFDLTSCICVFNSNLINIHVYPLSHLPSCNIYWTLFIFGICMHIVRIG